MTHFNLSTLGASFAIYALPPSPSSTVHVQHLPPWCLCLRSSQIQIACVEHLQPSHMPDGCLILPFHSCLRRREGERQRQDSTRMGWHALASSHDQTADGARPQPLCTPGAQDL